MKGKKHQVTSPTSPEDLLFVCVLFGRVHCISCLMNSRTHVSCTADRKSFSLCLITNIVEPFFSINYFVTVWLRVED